MSDFATQTFSDSTSKPPYSITFQYVVGNAAALKTALEAVYPVQVTVDGTTVTIYSTDRQGFIGAVATACPKGTPYTLTGNPY